MLNCLLTTDTGLESDILLRCGHDEQKPQCHDHLPLFRPGPNIPLNFPIIQELYS
jgi:hypothetical protein